MATELARFLSPPRSCSYLPAETASLEYRIYAGLTETRYRARLERGWRRHGVHLFRPVCPQCRQCRSLRVLVDQFRPSRSQRRTLQRNADVRLVVQRPTVTAEHIRLYNAYHRDMQARRGWPDRETDAAEYEQSFLAGDWPCAREFLYFRDDELIGVGLVDLFQDAVSSVYFYHDPEWRPQGPGTFSILSELEFCRETGRRYNYLGYWIAPCGSMAYKAGFRPHELLDEYVGDDETPVWRLAAEAP